MARIAIEGSLQGHIPVSRRIKEKVLQDFFTFLNHGGCIIRESENLFRNAFEILENSLMRQHFLLTFPNIFTPEMLSLPAENDRSKTSWAEFQHIIQLWKSLDLTFLSNLENEALEDMELYLDLKTTNKIIAHEDECPHSVAEDDSVEDNNWPTITL